MAMKKSRMMKVYGQSGYRYKATPTIMLKGQWLKDLGFDIGDYISVSCENGKLIITPDVNKAQEQAAKAAFMEAEIKKLEIRYKREKDEIQARYVAEQNDGCFGRQA